LFLIIPLVLVLLFDIYLIAKNFLKRKFNIKVFILTYFLFGSSIFALLTGIFLVGGVLGLIPIFIYLAFNANKFVKYLSNAPKKTKMYLATLFFLFLFEMIWTIFSDNILFAVEKDIFFVLYSFVGIYALLIFKTKQDFYTFILYMHFWVTLYILIMVITLDLSSNMYLLTNGYAGGENRIVMSRFLFIYMIGSIYLIKKNYFYFISLFPALYIYIFAAARGPLVGIIVALFLYMLVNIKRLMKQKVFYVSLIIVVSLVFILLLNVDLNKLSDHIMLAKRLMDTEHIANSARGHLFMGIYHHYQSIDIQEFFWGYGAGDSIYHIDYTYPHNFIVEFFFELGIIGLAIGIMLTYFNTSIYKNLTKDRLLFALIIMQGILFFSGMFSSSLHSMSHLMILTAIVYKYIEIKRRDKHEYSYH
jgi:hypothetical protein